MKHLLHICAEYYHLNCAKTLVKHGADVNSKAGIDSNGFGGQTPVFHTVNQHNNTCIHVMNFLASSLTLSGLIWKIG